jgi:hypothetical protein
MEKIDILVIIGLVAGIIGVVSLSRLPRYIFSILFIACMTIYSVAKPFYPLTAIMFVISILFIYIILKANVKRFSLKLEEADPNDERVKKFMNACKKDIYNFFPFYKFSENQRFFLVVMGDIAIGIFVYTISGDTLKVEVDYTKHIYRDLGTGNYIYNKNPGYFKKFGVNKVLSQSFNRTYSRSLKKLGFKIENINGQQFYVKNLD